MYVRYTYKNVNGKKSVSFLAKDEHGRVLKEVNEEFPVGETVYMDELYDTYLTEALTKDTNQMELFEE
jgi:hypothetical protein